MADETTTEFHPLHKTTFDQAREVHCTMHQRRIWTKTIWASGPSQLCDRCYRVLRHG